MTLSKILLAGVSVCALAAASPALAHGVAPNIHLATKRAGTKQAVETHVKTNIGDPGGQNLTTTLTFTAAISKSADYKKKTQILSQTWYNKVNCTKPTKEKWVSLPKKTKYAKISTTTSTGSISTCPGVVFTFHDIDYDLTSKIAKKDTVKGNLIANNFDGYNLKLIASVDVTIGK